MWIIVKSIIYENIYFIYIFVWEYFLVLKAKIYIFLHILFVRTYYVYKKIYLYCKYKLNSFSKHHKLLFLRGRIFTYFYSI